MQQSFQNCIASQVQLVASCDFPAKTVPLPSYKEGAKTLRCDKFFHKTQQLLCDVPKLFSLEYVTIVRLVTIIQIFIHVCYRRYH